nr:hypothetical protein [Bacteroides intestinalis]
MATNGIKYVLNIQLADNTVTVENKDDKIAVLVSAGTTDFQRVVSEIMEVIALFRKSKQKHNRYINSLTI